ncbi:MAG: TonB-dependent receptor [Flavobacteriaceae bacterium]|nr:TonB-dependent receptor [Flavobacteriaceae bacterium]
MKKLFVFYALLLIAFSTYAQEKRQDSTKIEKLDEVLITAIRVNAESPITFSNIYKEELNERNLGQDIPVLMNFLPNVVTTSDAGAGVGYTGIRVRGSDATRVNVTINGIPYNDSESHGTFWVNLGDFASSVESLQLQRGVGTSTNGAGAFGASLSILTETSTNEPSAEIASAVGSFNTFKNTLKFNTGTLNDHFELSGRLSKITSDGYIDRAESELKSYFFQGSYSDENTLIKGLVFGGFERTYQAWFGIDATTLENDRTFNPAGIYTDDEGNTQFYDNEVDNYNQDHYQLHWNQRIDGNWSTNLAFHYTYGRGYFEQYREDDDFSTYGFEPITVEGELVETTDLIRRRWLDNDFYGTTFSVNYKDDAKEIIIGGAYNKYDGDHFGEVVWSQFANNSEIRDRYYDNVANKNEFNIYSKGTFKIRSGLSLFADLQLRSISYKTRGINSDLIDFRVDDKFTFFNPKLGLTYKLNNKNSFYASFARANREPNRTDYENGNPRPEQLNDLELGWRFNTEKNLINANIYYMKYNDQLVLTGELDDVGAPLRANSGKSFRLGLEVDANLKFSDRISLLPNIAISTNKNLDFTRSLDGELVNLGETNISYSPNLVVGNSLEYSPNANFKIACLSKYVGEQYMSNFDVKGSKLDSYFTSDINIIYQIKTDSIFKGITITALVNNIFNTEYVSNGYYYTYDDTWSVPGEVTTLDGAGYYPQATTNFLLGATLNF